MKLSRRTFLKSSLVGGVGLSALGFDPHTGLRPNPNSEDLSSTETRSTCPYCSVSCGVIIYTLGDKAKNAIPQVVHVEGDPDHPINRGTLCPKGSSLEQDILNDRRLLKPQVRRRARPTGKTSRGKMPTTRSRRSKEDARRYLPRKRRAEPYREPLRKESPSRAAARHQRIQLSRRQEYAQPGGLLPENQARV